MVAVADLNQPGHRSVTNDIENVIADLVRVGALLSGDRVIYRDSDGVWDQVIIDDACRFERFESIGASSAVEAVVRLIAQEHPITPASDDDLLARGYLAPVRRFDNGRIACLMEVNPWLYAICTDLFEGGHDNAFYYRDRESATNALLAWDGTGEPSDWWRHPQSGRRRHDGDPSREYYQP
ncbi:hypothetical protein [Paraburkholderia sp. MM5384-R2]|uniref:hypothetical protein n=1 Tax=Paraburkholderia sp. MM5384-R2 TaxID=2723097 RepID=UPI0016130080|nr:hypothetical protein [Paraburkholderia sp. MM5384-R2]MBB5496877.1 hypothetical protein [Paraburkholderia sp. MM5384-R2]